MNPFEMVAFIVVVVMVASVARAWLRQRASLPVAPDAGHERRIAALEERVRAIEAIVTDHGYDLRKQFEDFEGRP
jgi:membrane protein implicated in regulation of membrane protease activity